MRHASFVLLLLCFPVLASDTPTAAQSSNTTDDCVHTRAAAVHLFVHAVERELGRKLSNKGREKLALLFRDTVAARKTTDVPRETVSATVKPRLTRAMFLDSQVRGMTGINPYALHSYAMAYPGDPGVKSRFTWPESCTRNIMSSFDYWYRWATSEEWYAGGGEHLRLDATEFPPQHDVTYRLWEAFTNLFVPVNGSIVLSTPSYIGSPYLNSKLDLKRNPTWPKALAMTEEERLRLSSVEPIAKEHRYAAFRATEFDEKPPRTWAICELLEAVDSYDAWFARATKGGGHSLKAGKASRRTWYLWQDFRCLVFNNPQGFSAVASTARTKLQAIAGAIDHGMLFILRREFKTGPQVRERAAELVERMKEFHVDEKYLAHLREYFCLDIESLFLRRGQGTRSSAYKSMPAAYVAKLNSRTSRIFDARPAHARKSGSIKGSWKYPREILPRRRGSIRHTPGTQLKRKPLHEILGVYDKRLEDLRKYPLVVYCDTHGYYSRKVIDELVSYGCTNITWLRDGFEDWAKRYPHLVQ